MESTARTENLICGSQQRACFGLYLARYAGLINVEYEETLRQSTPS